MHWRRKDFRRHHPSTFSNVVQVAASMITICEQTRLYQIFLATDTDIGEIESLRNALQSEMVATCDRNRKTELRRRRRLSGGECPTVELLTYKQPGSNILNPMQEALVEQLVASRALHFVGTLHSTFSHEIHYERKAHGVEWNTYDSTMVKKGSLVKGVQWSAE